MKYIKQTRFTALPLLLILVLFSYGCAIYEQYGELSTIDKASFTVEQLGYTFIGVHETYGKIYDKLPTDKQELLKLKVNPIMNRTQDAVSASIKAVAIWKRTGEKPQDVIKLINEAQSLITQLTQLVIDVKKDFNVKESE